MRNPGVSIGLGLLFGSIFIGLVPALFTAAMEHSIRCYGTLGKVEIVRRQDSNRPNLKRLDPHQVLPGRTSRGYVRRIASIVVPARDVGDPLRKDLLSRLVTGGRPRSRVLKVAAL